MVSSRNQDTPSTLPPTLGLHTIWIGLRSYGSFSSTQKACESLLGSSFWVQALVLFLEREKAWAFLVIVHFRA